MSQRRSAQFGLLLACLFLVTTIGILWAGNKAGMSQRTHQRQGVQFQAAPVQDVKLITMGK